MNELPGFRVHLAAFAAGAVLSIATDRSLAEQSASRRVAVYGAGLVGAAVVYPTAHLGRRANSTVLAREWIGVLAASTLSVGAAFLPKPWPARVIAGGWLAHAAFDLAHEQGPSSRLPRWYPALCAGYDVGVAAVLCAPGRLSEVARAIRDA